METLQSRRFNYRRASKKFQRTLDKPEIDKIRRNRNLFSQRLNISPHNQKLHKLEFTLHLPSDNAFQPGIVQAMEIGIHQYHQERWKI